MNEENVKREFWRSGLPPLFAANLIPIVLLMSGMIPGDWTRESKFFAICLCMVCAVVGIYNVGVESKDDRTVFSLGLAAVSLSLMAAIGTIFLH